MLQAEVQLQSATRYSEKECYQHVIQKVTLDCDMIRHWLICTVMTTDTCNMK